MHAHDLPASPIEIASRYVAIWNEGDPKRRRVLIEQTFAPQASYLDPLMQSAGHAGLDAMIGAAQAQFSGLRFSTAGKADGHHNVVRFSWSLGTEQAEPLACGTDVAVIGADGRIERVTGFLDKMPA